MLNSNMKLSHFIAEVKEYITSAEHNKYSSESNDNQLMENLLNYDFPVIDVTNSTSLKNIIKNLHEGIPNIQLKEAMILIVLSIKI